MSKILLANIKGPTGDVTPELTAAKVAAEAAASTATTKAAEAVAAAASVPTGAELSATIVAETAPKYAAKGAVPVALTAAAATGYFDPQLSLYNWKPSNTKRFRAALGKAIAGTDLCKIVCAGESTTAGRNLTNTEQAYPARLRDALVAEGIPLAGKGASYYSRGDAFVIDAFTTVTGTWTRVTNTLYAQSTTAGSTMTVTGTGTTLTIVSSNYGSGAFTYAIDGAAAVTVSNSGASSLKTTAVTGLSAGAHTVVLSYVSGTVTLYSVEMRNTTGLSVTNAGASGSNVNDYWPTNQFFYNYGAVAALQPHLVIFGISINDLVAGRSPAAYKTAMSSTLSGFKATGDVIIATTNAATSGSFTDAQLAAYNKVLYELADQLDLPLIDVFHRLPSYTEANSLGLMYDTFHPNAAFHAERGRHHARALLAG